MVNNLNKVSHYAYKHLDTQSAIEAIPYKIVSTIRQDLGMPCDDEEERIKRHLSSSYVSFYERNIVNYSLSLLGDDYSKLKQQVWGVAFERPAEGPEHGFCVRIEGSEEFIVGGGDEDQPLSGTLIDLISSLSRRKSGVRDVVISHRGRVNTDCPPQDHPLQG